MVSRQRGERAACAAMELVAANEAELRRREVLEGELRREVGELKEAAEAELLQRQQVRTELEATKEELVYTSRALAETLEVKTRLEADGKSELTQTRTEHERKEMEWDCAKARLEGEIDVLKAALEAALAERDVSEARYGQLQIRFEEVSADVSRLGRELSAATSKAESLEKRLGEKEKLVEELEAELARLRQLLRDLEEGKENAGERDGLELSLDLMNATD